MKEVTREHFENCVNGWHWEVISKINERLYEVKGTISNKRFMVRIIN